VVRSTHGRDEKFVHFIRKREESPLGRPRRRWEDNIRMDLTKILLEVLDWVHLV
jgi:hypothetical protein